MGGKVKELLTVAATVAIGMVLPGGGGFALKTFAMRTAVTFGLGQVARALAPKPSFDLEAQQARSDITTVSPISSHKVLYGQCVTGGTLVYSNLTAEDDSMLNMVVALAPHEIRGVRRVLLNGEDILESYRGEGVTYYTGTEYYKEGNAWTTYTYHFRGWQLNIIGVIRGYGQIVISDANDATVYKTIQNLSSEDKVVNEVIDFSLYNSSGSSVFVAISKTNISGYANSDSDFAIYNYSMELNSKYKNLVNVSTWLGDVAQQYEKGLGMQVATDYDVSAGSDWDIGTANSQDYGHYMANTAYIYLRCKYDQDIFGGQAPNVAVEVTGKPLIDPTDDAEKTDAQSLSNPALCLYDYLTNDEYGCGISEDEIDKASFTAGRNLCNEVITVSNFGSGTWKSYSDSRFTHDWGMWEGDELTETLPVTVGDTLIVNVSSSHGAYLEVLTVSKVLEGGRSFITDYEWQSGDAEESGKSFTGYIYRYRLDGVIDTANSKKLNIESMLATMAAKLTYTSGKFTLVAGEYVSPSGTINEEDIVGPITISTRPPARDLFNRVQGIYNSANDEYVASSFEAYEDSTAVSEDQDIVSAIDLQLPLTRNHKHAEMLAQIALDRSRLFKVIDMTVNMTGLKYKVGDTVNLNYARASITNEVYEIIDLSINLDEAPTVSLVLQEMSDIYPS